MVVAVVRMNRRGIGRPGGGTAVNTGRCCCCRRRTNQSIGQMSFHAMITQRIIVLVVRAVR